MDYLDPKKHKAHLVRLAIGYILIAVALVLTAIILLYHARGFGIKNGEVIQSGLIFISSRPEPADIYINGDKNDKTTNTRLLMQAGQYTFELKRDGYRSWKRAINVEGGVVVRFDYPVLFPTNLSTNAVKTYSVRPSLVTQSPDRRWLLVQHNSAFNTFDLFDLEVEETQIVPETLTVPENLFTHKTGTHSWKLMEWSTDNRRALVQHTTKSGSKVSSEYLIIDREAPRESVNLTKTFGSDVTNITLRDKKYDQYFIYKAKSRELDTASLKEPTLQPLLKNVLSFKSHGKDTVLYTTTDDADAGKAAVKLLDGDRTYKIREIDATGTHLLDIARYDRHWYMVAGAAKDDRVYVYRDPASSINDSPEIPVVPVQVFKVADAQYVAFSDNARFIMAQGKQKFAIYDAENDNGYAYTTEDPMDAAQQHARWMDGHRLMYVSGGKALVFDFDNANSELLSAADPAYVPYFDRDFKNLFTITAQKTTTDSGTATRYQLGRTSLLTPEDQ